MSRLSHRHNRFRLWRVIGLAGVLVAVLSAIFAVVTVAVAGRTPPPVSQKVADAYASQGALLTPVDTRPTAVFIGDSYASGTGASSPATRWTTLASTALNWKEVNIGRGSTSYLATGTMAGCGLDYCPNYLQMVPEAVKHSPSIVIVSGGQNDFSNFEKRPQSVVDAINATYQAIHEKLPDAKVVAVGPSTPWGVGDTVTRLDKAVQEAAKANGATYVSLIAPDVVDMAMVAKDGAHVLDSGHAAIAERVESALR